MPTRFLRLQPQNRNRLFMENRPPFLYQATVGIDWADRKHDVFVRFANGSSYRRKIGSRPEAIQEWLFELRSACAEGKIAIALEQRRGALFYQLCTHLNWIDLYPINPHSLSSSRLTFFSSRAKDDPKDGQLLEELLRTHCDRLRPYQPAVNHGTPTRSILSAAPQSAGFSNQDRAQANIDSEAIFSCGRRSLRGGRNEV